MYAVFNISDYGGKSRTIKLDIDSAINDSKYNSGFEFKDGKWDYDPDKKAIAHMSDAVENNPSDIASGGVTRVVPLALKVKEKQADVTDAYTKILLVADKGKDEGMPNLKARVETTTNVKTNYDKALGNPRIAEVVFEDKPRETVRMQRSNGMYILPVNKDSVINDRVHFVPINWKNNTKLKGQIKVEGPSTPGGTLRDCINESVTINGHMYEDDYNAPNRRY